MSRLLYLILILILISCNNNKPEVQVTPQVLKPHKKTWSYTSINNNVPITHTEHTYYEYDNNKRIKEIIVKDGFDIIGDWFELIYNSEGIITNFIFKNYYGEELYSFDFTYNEFNQITSQSFNDLEGNLILQKEFSYPDQNTIIKKTIDKQVLIHTFMYVLDENKNCIR